MAHRQGCRVSYVSASSAHVGGTSQVGFVGNTRTLVYAQMPKYDARALYAAKDFIRRRLPQDSAYDWLEAENDAAVWAIVQKWFEYMESGQAAHMYPDPAPQPKRGCKPLTPELADYLIAELDDDFNEERGRFPEGHGPEFSRLLPHARLAFAQELYGAMKTGKELETAAKQAIREGLLLPPPMPDAISVLDAAAEGTSVNLVTAADIAIGIDNLTRGAVN